MRSRSDHDRRQPSIVLSTYQFVFHVFQLVLHWTRHVLETIRPGLEWSTVLLQGTVVRYLGCGMMMYISANVVQFTFGTLTQTSGKLNRWGMVRLMKEGKYRRWCPQQACYCAKRRLRAHLFLSVILVWLLDWGTGTIWWNLINCLLQETNQHVEIKYNLIVRWWLVTCWSKILLLLSNLITI